VSLCVDDWLTGLWDESLALAEEGAELSRAQGNRRFAEILGGYVRPLILAARGGDDDELRPVEDLAQWAAAHRLGTLTTFARHVRMLAAVSRGDFDNAYRHATAISPPGVLARYTPHALWVLFDLVESAVRTGRDVEAAAHVAAIRAADLASISPRLALVSSGCAALIATGDDASAWYEQAIAVPGADRSPFELGRVQLAYGEHLRRARAGVAAQTHLAAAMDIFERLGATPWLTRAGGEVRALGRTTARGGPPAATALLSQQELEITQLAASGLTNREIGERLYLSPRTIGAHLYKVYPKLGVTSRAALRDALASLE
jgi:DNA-binding CsgD family transcriptional regulator